MLLREIYSKIKRNKLMHVVCINTDVDERVNVCSDDALLQLAFLPLKEGQTFKAHKHIDKPVKINGTAEGWVVLRGRVKAILYDLDDTILEEVELGQGDCSITICPVGAGHNYLCLENNSLVLEVKSGPYMGILADKEFIDE